jgi:hypothetical protein
MSDPAIRTTALEMMRVLNLDTQNERLVGLCCKYHVYNQQVLDDTKELAEPKHRVFDEEPPIAPPQLYDLLLTGCALPYAKHSRPSFSETSAQDAADILRLMPSAANFRRGSLRCRDEVHCAAAACHNLDLIPFKVVKEILPHLNWMQTGKLNGKAVTVLEDVSCAPKFRQLCEALPSAFMPVLLKSDFLNLNLRDH